MSATRRLDKDWHRFLRASARKIDRDGIDSASFETDDVGFHRRSIARCAMTEDDSHDAYRRSPQRSMQRSMMVVIGATSAEISTTLSKKNILEPFFFQAEDGIRDLTVTGVQTCALPI